MRQSVQTLWASAVGRGLVLVGVLAIFLPAVSRVHSFDIFWQLQSGRHILETAQFIRTDIFTLTSDAFRYEHTWLHDLIVYGLYQLGDYAAISWWKGTMLALTAIVLVLAARRRESDWLAIFLVLPVFFLTRGGWLERPQLWTFLLFALFIGVLEGYRKAHTRQVWVLLPLMLFWANVHAGAVLAAAVLAAYLVGEGGDLIVKRSQLSVPSYRRLWLVSLLLVGASATTPYPSQLWKTLKGVAWYGASSGRDGQVTGPLVSVFNMDWSPTSFAAEPFFFYAMGLTAAIILLGWRRWSFVDICLVCGLAIMGLKLRRHIPFFYMGMIVVLPVYLGDIGRRLASIMPAQWKAALVGFVCLAGCALLGYMAIPAYRTHGVLKSGLRAWHYPVAAAEFVKENRLPVNLYNTYDWGGYLAWRLFPDYLVFWDGRQTSPKMFKLGWNVMSGKPDWQEILDRFEVNTIVSKACTMDTAQHYPLLDRLRDSPDWSLVMQDGSSTVFVRNEAIDPLWLADHRLDKRRIDEAILTEARLLVADNPSRYVGWWEIARIYMERRQHREALQALEQYLRRTPVRDPQAERYYRVLSSIVRSSKSAKPGAVR